MFYWADKGKQTAEFDQKIHDLPEKGQQEAVDGGFGVDTTYGFCLKWV